jgi:hypothetical protein
MVATSSVATQLGDDIVHAVTAPEMLRDPSRARYVEGPDNSEYCAGHSSPLAS